MTSELLLTPTNKAPASRRPRTYTEFRSGIDQRVLRLFAHKGLRRTLREQTKLNFQVLWALTVKALDADRRERPTVNEPPGQSYIHRSIIAGLPGEALFISSAMAFDSMHDALPFFEVSAKTARLRLGSLLAAGEGEMALRIGRVLIMAGEAFGSFEGGRRYLRTPNFALGGDIPRDLLKTAEGEQLVLTELQTQTAGGPVRLYRARAWRGAGPPTFDPLNSSASVTGPKGWRYNDLSTEILYAAEVEALAVLEVAVRPGWETIYQVLVATIDIPDHSVATLEELAIVLPGNWNARPAADDSRLIAREFLDAVAHRPAGSPRPMALRVPSVLSVTDFNVLIDPSRKAECAWSITHRVPFKTARHG